MEGGAHHERFGTDQRGVSASHQNPGLPAQRGCRAVITLWAVADWADQAAASGRGERDAAGPCDGRGAGGIENNTFGGQPEMGSTLFHRLTDTTQIGDKTTLTLSVV